MIIETTLINIHSNATPIRKPTSPCPLGIMVGPVGIEPTLQLEQDFKSCASASSAIVPKTYSDPTNISLIFAAAIWSLTSSNITTAKARTLLMSYTSELVTKDIKSKSVSIVSSSGNQTSSIIFALQIKFAILILASIRFGIALGACWPMKRPAYLLQQILLSYTIIFLSHYLSTCSLEYLLCYVEALLLPSFFPQTLLRPLG